jgi:hypothetical protein
MKSKNGARSTWTNWKADSDNEEDTMEERDIGTRKTNEIFEKEN